MAKKNLIKKLISNTIVQSFVIYVSGGWIVLEMTDYIIDKYELNPKIGDVLPVILLIGVPIVLILSWYVGREKDELAEKDEVSALDGKSPVQSERRKQKDSVKVSYQIRRPQIILSGALILLAIVLTLVFRLNRQSNISWAREVAIPEIEEIANDINWEGHRTWNAFNLANEAVKYIPDDHHLANLKEKITWNVTINSQPAKASVYIKSYEDTSDDWKYIGSTPIEGIMLPRGSSKIKIEKEGYRDTYDLIWDHWSFAGNSLHYQLIEVGSIPERMELLTDTLLSLTFMPWVGLPGVEHIENEKTGNFLMDRFEVTNQEFKQFVDSRGYQNRNYWKYPIMKNGKELKWEEAMALFTDKTGRSGPATWQIGDYPDGQDEFPVSGISWYEAAAYAEFAGKSLPTIYHWNQAAYPYASAVIVPMSNINNKNNGAIRVGDSQSMNRLGIYDLAGNVREWCYNGTEKGNRRFILGGGWNDALYSFNDANAQSPLDRSEINGFRCIQYLDSVENISTLKKAINLPYRDFLNEPIVSDEIFATFLRQYKYDKTELNARIEDVTENEEYIREKITLDAAYGDERFTAYLFLPKNGTPPYQVVVYFPGSGALHQGSSEQLTPRMMFPKSDRAFLWPIYKSTFERGDELTSDIANGTNFYKEHVIMWAKDLGRSIDYLETRNDINTDKLAYFGYSWGGYMGGILPAVEPRIKISVLLVAGLEFQKGQPEVEPIHFLPRIKIPVLMLNGKYDFFFPYETSQIPFYQLLGTPDAHKRMYLYDQGHNVPEIQLAKETLAWLDQYLGPVK